MIRKSITQRKFRSMKNYTSTFRLPPRQNERLNQNKSMAVIYGEWLNTMEWDFYCTFTTRYSMSREAARNSMYRLNNFLTEQYCFKPTIFWVAEPFDTKYGYHLHALLKVQGKPTSNLAHYIKKAWQIVSKGKYGKEYNFTVIKPYDANLGGNYYVAKYLHRYDSDYGFA